MMENVHRPELVASDVDGTLLDPLGGITERTGRMIRAVAAAGVPFVLASGRPPRWIPPISKAAGLTGYAVCANGATVYDIGQDEVLSVRGLDPVQLTDIVHAVSAALPEIAVSAERTAVGSPLNESYAMESEFQNPWGDPHGVETVASEVTRAEVLGRTATKLLIRHRGMTSDRLAAAVREVLGDAPVELTYSSNSGLLEVSAGGVTKASGLEIVCDLLGVRAEQVVAFGDMPNDVPMLQWVGHGVAMANAHADLLAVADEITAPNSEDGVAQVLERWF
jgi:Cof subfamily protein (haloacid dehalogenase superfamily)